MSLLNLDLVRKNNETGFIYSIQTKDNFHWKKEEMKHRSNKLKLSAGQLGGHPITRLITIDIKGINHD